MSDIAEELAQLHTLTGADFSRQVERIARLGDFHPLVGETDIYKAAGQQDNDFENLLNAARKAVARGYRVFILPNPKGIRTADFILAYKNVYKMYDLKTIQGRSSAGNRLQESIGQCSRILLNLTADYDTRLLASDIKRYFESNGSAVEVMIFKGKKTIVIDRFVASHPSFFRLFMKRYEK